MIYNHAMEVNLKDLKSDQRQKNMTELANRPTDEEFTALHFATYNGNYNLIRFLVDTAQVDINKRNKFGSSVLHIAA